VADLFIKICGVRTQEDAEAAAAAGADAVGFNFWPRSKRHVPLDEILPFVFRLPEKLRRIGVFVDPTVEEVEAALESRAIEVAQLHGDEPPEFARRFPGRTIKAIRLGVDADLDLLEKYAEPVLIDAPTLGYGGSGQRVATPLAVEAARRRRIILAGGLTPDNVAQAVAQVRPWGIDVAGGVELAPGRKDPMKMAQFIERARKTA
jgi:phosphoribosylanthranilate isomerase